MLREEVWDHFPRKDYDFNLNILLPDPGALYLLFPNWSRSLFKKSLLINMQITWACGCKYRNAHTKTSYDQCPLHSHWAHKVLTMGWSYIVLFLLAAVTGNTLPKYRFPHSQVTMASTMPFSLQVWTQRSSCYSLGLSWWSLGLQWRCLARLQDTPSLATLCTG